MNYRLKKLWMCIVDKVWLKRVYKIKGFWNYLYSLLMLRYTKSNLLVLREAVKNILQRAGFIDVKKAGRTEGLTPHLDQLEPAGRELETLYVEAIKRA